MTPSAPSAPPTPARPASPLPVYYVILDGQGASFTGFLTAPEWGRLSQSIQDGRSFLATRTSNTGMQSLIFHPRLHALVLSASVAIDAAGQLYRPVMAMQGSSDPLPPSASGADLPAGAIARSPLDFPDLFATIGPVPWSNKVDEAGTNEAGTGKVPA